MKCPISFYLGGGQQYYVLSVILSFLNENEGTSLLITNKKWSRRVLPMFQIPEHLISIICNTTTSQDTITNNITSSGSSGGTRNNIRKIKPARHRYRVMPVQDSANLMAKLNTKRLATRIRRSKLYHKKLVIDEEKKDGKNCNYDQYSYPLNMTTDEIAWYEWNQSRLQFVSTTTTTKTKTTATNNTTTQKTEKQTQHPSSSITTKTKWKANLELLRYRLPPPTYHNKSKLNIMNPLSQIQSTSIQPPPKILPYTTLLTSYPRSGNTLLRNLLERITNIVTGSDTRPDRTLSKSLALDHDLVGEGIVNSTLTPIIKTHFPERTGFTSFNASRIILLVRNPYDAIDSYWNMCCTNTHTESVEEDVYKLYEDKFRNLAMHEMETWLKFIKYWLLKGNTTFEPGAEPRHDEKDNKSTNKDRPSLLVIRFEDLILHTEHVIAQVVSFMIHGVASRDKERELHPFWKWRIKHGLDLISSSTTTKYDADKASSSHTNEDLSKTKCEEDCNEESTDNAVQCNNANDTEMKNIEQRVNTLRLGSYKPRSEKEDKLSSIGKSIRKDRYCEDIMLHFQKVAEKEENQINAGEKKINLLKLFEYDIPKQNFPYNVSINPVDEEGSQFFTLEQYYNIHKQQKSQTRKEEPNCMINIGTEIRPTNSSFGRAMTRWRHTQTCNDTIPFPIKKR